MLAKLLYNRAFLAATAVGFTAVSAQAAGIWTIEKVAPITTAPITDLQSDGTVIASANFGDPANVTAPVTVSGITFGTDSSGTTAAAQITAVHGSYLTKAAYYGGSDPDTTNLLQNVFEEASHSVNTGSYIGFNLSGLTVGQDYRFQALVGKDSGYADINLYGINTTGDYKYTSINGAALDLLTYEWTADSATRTISVGVGKSFQFLDVSGYVVTAVPEPASLSLLGLGGLSLLGRRRAASRA